MVWTRHILPEFDDIQGLSGSALGFSDFQGPVSIVPGSDRHSRTFKFCAWNFPIFKDLQVCLKD